MHVFERSVIPLVLLLFCGGWSLAQTESTPSDPYFSLLQEDPDNDYLYDRFYKSWLDTGTPEQLEAFLKAHLDRKKDVNARLWLALFYERQGQDAKALEVYRQWPADASISGIYLFHKAQAEARALEFETAISDLVKARSLPCPEETMEKIGKQLGELYIRTHQKDKAEALWKQLLEAGNKDQTLYEDLIELQIKEGLFDEALRTSDKLISLTQDPYKAVMRRLRKGDVYLYKAAPPKALEVYAEALDQAGQGSWLENQICSQIEQVFDRNDDPNGLKDYLTGLVKAHPERTGLKKRLAGLLVKMGDADKSLALLKEVLDVTPGDKANQKAYAETLAEAGQLDRAIALLEPSLKDANPDRETLIRLAELYHRNKQDDRVGTPLNRFLDLSGKTESAYLQVGGTLEQYQLRDQAEAVYRRMVEDLAGSLYAQQDLAEFLCRVNKEKEALDLFKAIAGKGDLQMMIRACDAAGARGHYDLALPWAEARFSEFSEEVSYLNHLCKMAIRLKASDKAVLWARRQLDKAQTFPMIRAALSEVMTAVETGERAERLIQELEAADTRTLQQACLLSELLELQNRPEKADAVLAEAARTHPDIALRQQAQLYGLRRDWARAAQTLEALITRTGPRELDLIRELIDLHQRGGRYEDALKWVLVWEKISPAQAAPRIVHAQLLDALDRHDEALGVLDSADREFDGPAEVLSPLAAMYTSIGRSEEAQRTYWRLYEAAKDTSEKLRWIKTMSEAAGQAGQRQELIERLQHQHQMNRSSAVPLLALADVYRQMGQYEERRQALLEATRLQTDDIKLMHELAAVEEAQGDWEKAAETLQRAMARDATAETRLKIARLYIQHGNQEEGFRILTNVAGGDKMDPRDAESIASSLLSIGSWEAASRLLQGLLALHPRDYRLHYQYAIALEEAGRNQEALEAFIDLLGFKDELPGVTTPKTQFSWNRQGIDVDLQQILPAQAVDLLRWSPCLQKAYGYRRERWHPLPPGMNRSTGTVHVTLPPCVEDLRDFALSHVLTLAADLSAPERSQVESDLSRQGIPQPSLFMKVSRSGLSNFNQTIEELAIAYPDDQAIQSIWILQRMEGRGCTLTVAQRLFDLFEKTHPRLAIAVGLRCGGTDPVASRLRSRALEMLQTVSDPGYYEVSSIVYALENERNGIKLTDRQRDFLDSHLVGWYAHIKQSAPSRINIFNCIASMLARRTDLSEYVRLLDEEIASHRNPPSSTPPYGSDQPVIRPLPYPPKSIPDFPSHVVSAVLDPPRYSFNLPLMSRLDSFNPARLRLYVDKAKNPILKVLLAIASGRGEEAEALIRALPDTDQTSLASYVLAAGLADRKDQPLQVMSLLDKARSLPMSQEDQRGIDGAMVASAMELDPNKNPGEVEIGRKAAVRLMRDRLSPAQREELLVATEALGMTEQAEHLKNQILAADRNRAVLPGSTPYAPIDISFVKRFFENGNTDSAVRLTRDYLMNAADRSLYPHLTGSPHASTMTPLVNLIRQYHAADKLMEGALPPEKASPRRLVEYGWMCELLGNDKNATAAYERALAQDAGDPAARIQLALLSAKTDPDKSAAHLMAIDKGRMATVGPSLATLVRNLWHQGDIEAALDVADGVRAYLDRVRDSAMMDLDWVDQVAGTIAEPCWRRNDRLNSLYQNPSQPSSPITFQRGQPSSFSTRMTFSMSSSGLMGSPMQMGWGPGAVEDVKVSDRRRAIHDRLCRRMLDLPPLAEAGFSRLAAEAKARNALTEEYEGMARQALLTARPTPSGGLPPVLSTANVTVNGQRSEPVDPVKYLVQHAYERGTLDGLANTFIPQLRQNQKNDRADEMASLTELYTVPSEDFFSTAGRFLGKASGQGVGHEGEALQGVIEAYLARHLDKDEEMNRLILDKLKEEAAQGRADHQGPAEYWLSHLNSKDQLLATAFLDSVIALYEGPGSRFPGLGMMFRQYARTLNPIPGNTITYPPDATRRPSRIVEQNTPNRGRSNRTDLGRINRRRVGRR